jgi:alkanesulfonate monooxygenase SsuD/methylene tetrahydromethanopterin reductase-like flavin-dependent oxidoreductase (luciferase family)
MDPKPVQKPRPPIVYGGVTAAGARRAARFSDGLYPLFLDP